MAKVRTRLEKETERSKQGLANKMKTVQDQLSNLQVLISKYKKDLSTLPNPNDFHMYNLDSDTFSIELQDLITKGLIIDLSVTQKHFEAFEIYNLSGLGRRFINYIRE